MQAALLSPEAFLSKVSTTAASAGQTQGALLRDVLSTLELQSLRPATDGSGTIE